MPVRTDREYVRQGISSLSRCAVPGSWPPPRPGVAGCYTSGYVVPAANMDAWDRQKLLRIIYRAEHNPASDTRGSTWCVATTSASIRTGAIASEREAA